MQRWQKTKLQPKKRLRGYKQSSRPNVKQRLMSTLSRSRKHRHHRRLFRHSLGGQRAKHQQNNSQEPSSLIKSNQLRNQIRSNPGRKRIKRRHRSKLSESFKYNHLLSKLLQLAMLIDNLRCGYEKPGHLPRYSAHMHHSQPVQDQDISGTWNVLACRAISAEVW